MKGFITKELKKCIFPWNLEEIQLKKQLNCSKYDFSFDKNKELKGYDFIMELVSDVRLFKRLVSVLKFYLYFYVRFAHCVYP